MSRCCPSARLTWIDYPLFLWERLVARNPIRAIQATAFLALFSQERAGQLANNLKSIVRFRAEVASMMALSMAKILCPSGTILSYRSSLNCMAPTMGKKAKLVQARRSWKTIIQIACLASCNNFLARSLSLMIHSVRNKRAWLRWNAQNHRVSWICLIGHSHRSMKVSRLALVCRSDHAASSPNLLEKTKISQTTRSTWILHVSRKQEKTKLLPAA